jgi:hypothetical protein
LGEFCTLSDFLLSKTTKVAHIFGLFFFTVKDISLFWPKIGSSTLLAKIWQTHMVTLSSKKQNESNVCKNCQNKESRQNLMCVRA